MTMPAAQKMQFALRQTLDKSRGLSGFLSRLSIAGLVLAVALLLTVLSVMNGFERELEQRILGLVPHLTIRGSGSDEDWQVLKADLEDVLPVTEIALFLERDVLMVRGNRVAPGILLGLPDDALARWSGMVAERLSAEDAKGLWLGEALAQRLAVNVGDKLRLIIPDTQDILPAGNLSQSPSAKQLASSVSAIVATGTELDEGLILTQFDTVAQLGDSSGSATGLAMQVSDLYAAPRLRWQLMQSLDRQFYVTDWTSMHGNLHTAIQLSRDLVTLLLLSIIAVAAFNIVSSLILVVRDRQATIAMLRAMGASHSDVSQIYLLQGGIIGVVGASAGILLGVLLAYLVPQIAALIEQLLSIRLLSTDVYPLAFVPVDIRLVDAALLWGVSVVLCLLAAVIPARRAARTPVAHILAQQGFS